MKKLALSFLLISAFGSTTPMSSGCTHDKHSGSGHGATHLNPPNFAQWQNAILHSSSRTALVTALLASFGYLYSKQPVHEFTSKFDAKKLHADPFTREYWKNVFEFFDKVVIGQPYEPKSHKIGDSCCDDHMIQLHEHDCPARGLLGLTDYYVLRIGRKTVENLGSMFLLYHLVNHYGVYKPIEEAAGNKVKLAPSKNN